MGTGVGVGDRGRVAWSVVRGGKDGTGVKGLTGFSAGEGGADDSGGFAHEIDCKWMSFGSSGLTHSPPAVLRKIFILLGLCADLYRKILQINGLWSRYS